jgi:trans-2,3-dihydro-3-hydroxyanthranilate isomerase
MLKIMFGRAFIINGSLAVRLRGHLIFMAHFIFCSLAISAAAAQELAEANPARAYHYDQWDVFTEEPLTGNQLAVFPEPQGLTKSLMQSIAREMAFSETTFIFPSDDENVDFRVRIFGPDREFSFAGHPTIGTAFSLAQSGSIPPGTERITFREGIGPVVVELEWNRDKLHFAWMHDRVPTFGKTLRDVNGISAALGLEPLDLNTTVLPIQEISAGASFLFVPLTSRAAVDRATLNASALSAVLEKATVKKQSVFLFSTERGNDVATVYGRKLGVDGREDPATGSAAGPLGCYLFRYGVVGGKEIEHLLIRQGVQMGRPSWLHVRIDVIGEEITSVQVGGNSVFIGDGRIILSDD